MSTITHISSLPDLTRVLEANKNKLSVIDFHASCHQIAPKYEALSKEHTNVAFTKCDVDAAQDVSQKYGITAMPSFVFIKNGQKVDLVRGANPKALEEAIKKHSSGSTGGFSGQGHTLGSSATPSSVPTPSETITPFAVLESWAKLDPQVQILLLLVGGFVGFLLLSFHCH
ncbi:hypothetical protein BS47DRAFT_1373991 [Hydnum rufescens UP504]|uniref:Thioredoxin domain-containing protein n=1 Tax=Hydnum rufescens UP504 TaxID=1448309 RepID=A0A9P6AKH4_9AGAM|nr:hypothetical protein BS47DRAFT_1373991 [Hydnum rufescens UP504]